MILFRSKSIALFCLLGAILLLTSSCGLRGGAGRDFIPTVVAPLQPGDVPPESILLKFFEIEKEQGRLENYQVDVRIVASLPAMHKSGTLTATRILRGESGLSYKGSSFTGDESVKGDVIARYLNAEKESLRRPLNIGINLKNYRFTYRGTAMYLDRRAHVFEVNPKDKNIGLYRGELWVDIETSQPLREFGRFVRNPSVFLKNVDFVRDFHLINGRAVPARIITRMDTRLVGPAEITVYFSNYDFHLPPESHEVSIAKPTRPGRPRKAPILE
ncbi:MAG: hypothetical protein IT169_15925 [Bryobacterales bacterium]|nr:hypothetical protein [Bryobacterales bacterium]